MVRAGVDALLLPLQPAVLAPQNGAGGRRRRLRAAQVAGREWRIWARSRMAAIWPSEGWPASARGRW
jgi:hypothetical protein